MQGKVLTALRQTSCSLILLFFHFTLKTKNIVALIILHGSEEIYIDVFSFFFF